MLEARYSYDNTLFYIGVDLHGIMHVYTLYEQLDDYDLVIEFTGNYSECRDWIDTYGNPFSI